MPYVDLPGVHLWYNDTGGTGTPVVHARRLRHLRELGVPVAGVHCGRLPVQVLRPAQLGRSRPDLTGARCALPCDAGKGLKALRRHSRASSLAP